MEQREYFINEPEHRIDIRWMFETADEQDIAAVLVFGTAPFCGMNIR